MSIYNFNYQEKIFSTAQELNKNINKDENLILSINIRSLKANLAKLETFIKRLKIMPHVIVCTETWRLDKHTIFNLNGYKIYYNESNINQNDGVVIYIKKKLFETTKILEFGRLKILHTKIQINNNKVIALSALYRSHDMPEAEFVHNLKNFLIKYKTNNNHLITGDFNINIAQNSNIGQELLSNFLEKEYLPAFTSITRPNGSNPSIGTCIDNFYIKEKSISFNAFKITSSFTDHYPLILTFNETTREKQRIIPNRINFNKLSEIADKTDWDKIIEIMDPNIATDSLISIINKCTDQARRVEKKKQGNSSNKPRSNWITKAIIKSCNTKDKLYKNWKHDVNNKKLEKIYKNYCKTLDKVIVAAKAKYEQNIFKNNKNNPKKLWQLINAKLGKAEKENKEVEYILDNNKRKIENNIDIANFFNEYFCNIGPKLSEKIQSNTLNNNINAKHNEKSIFLYPINTGEVTNAITELKDKSGGVDNINTKIIKTIIHQLQKPLEHIFNQCIINSVWPDALKKAEVIPLHKSGKQNNTSNYRPISLISNIAKVFEKIIHKRIYSFAIKHKIFADNQYGFLKNRSTKDAFVKLTSKIYNNLDNSKPTIATFLDLAKAFDTVNHEILIKKLQIYGIRGNALDLIKSYLTNRKQKVRLNGVYSSERAINTGVPQGTILGPLLFVIYINDMLTGIIDDLIISYADDTVILTEGKTWKEAEQKMNKSLRSIEIWLASNKLSLNTDKTVYVTFGNYKDSVPTDVQIRIYNINLKRVENCKYLGIFIDYKMKWNKHVNHVINKTKYLIYVFANFAKIMDSSTLLMLYHALFHSVATYGIIAWGGAYQNSIGMLQSLQSKLLRIISKNTFITKNFPLNLQQSFHLEAILYNYPTLKTKYINSESKTRKKSIPMPKINKKIINKDCYIIAIRIFNELPNDLKVIVKLNSLKLKLKSWIKEYFYVTKF